MKSLLLVEDQLTLAMQIQQGLEKARFRVELAGDFDSAQELVNKDHFDLIVLSPRLKEERGASMGGDVALVRHFRDAGINIPILVHGMVARESEPIAFDTPGPESYLGGYGESLRTLHTRILAYFRREERLLETRFRPTTRSSAAPVKSIPSGLLSIQPERRKRIFSLCVEYAPPFHCRVSLQSRPQ